jgi:RimJ/RimL family protein N-acetyltransferase
MVPEEIAVAGGLVLRRWRPADAGALLAAIEASLPELRRFMPWAMERPTLRSVKAYLNRPDTSMAFGLFDVDGEVVGAFGLHDRQGPGILEIGYWVRSDRTGRGYATAAAGALTTVALECFPFVDRIEIRCDPANGASAAVARKLGYALDRVDVVDIEAEAQTGEQQVWASSRATWRPSAGRPARPAARRLR